jgi:uncharacterized protein (TIGR03083 family)
MAWVWSYDAPMDVGVAYRDLRVRVLQLVQDLTPEQWETVVPHCPDWTVRQTLAHLAGIVDDGINNNMEGVTTEPWTKAQVDKRANNTGPEIADEWATWAPFVEARASQQGLALSQLLFDAVTHEHDIRFALGFPGARQSEALDVAAHFLVNWLLAKPNGSPISLVLDGVERITSAQARPGAPVLTASTFDAVRSLGSRRSVEQVLALDWSYPPSAELLLQLSPFGHPTVSLAE